MQTFGITARSSITDLAASNAFNAVKPCLTVAVFRSNEFRRCLRAGAQALDRGVLDHPDPAFTGVWQGQDLRRRVERPDAVAALDASRGANVPSPQDVPDMDQGRREPARNEDQGHRPYVGPVR